MKKKLFKFITLLSLSFISISCSNNKISNERTNTSQASNKINVEKSNNNQTNNVSETKTSNNLIYKYDNTNKYYESLNGKKGEELFNAIYDIQKSKISGIGGYSDLYKTYETAFVDKYFEKNNTILDIYSENPNGDDPYEFPVGFYDGTGSKGSLKRKAGGEGEKYNREHMIPQSKFNKANPTRNDAHFVWPTDKIVNQWRGNLPHLPVSKGKVTLNGTKIDNSAAEPIDFFKGDTARTYFYFQVTHKNANWPGIFEKSYPYFSKNVLDIYKDWTNLDKVDNIEVDRNNAIAKAQGGLRNPFIDYPELVELIWDKNTNKTFENKGVLISIENL